MSVTVSCSSSSAPTVTNSTVRRDSFAWSNIPSTIDTCTSPAFEWDYAGPRETLLFRLIPELLCHTPGANSGKDAINTTLLAADVDGAAAAWTWPKVNVTAGQYVVGAYGPDFTVLSSTFVIAHGADTSCLASVINNHSSITTLSAALTTSSAKPFVPRAEPSDDGPSDVITITGSIFGGTAAIAFLILAFVKYRQARRRRRGQSRPSSPAHRSADAAQSDWRDLPSVAVASTTQRPRPLADSERGADGPHPLLTTGTTDLPLVPNRRPPSLLLSSPEIDTTPPDIPRPRVMEGEVSTGTVGSRVSTAASGSTRSTAGLAGTFSSCPPSYVTSSSHPPSYATDSLRSARTPRSAHFSYASSS